MVTVSESGGAAVADAWLEVWRGTEVVATRTSDRAGRAILPSDIAGETSVLIVRRIGFAPHRQAFAELSEVSVVLTRLAQALPLLTVSEARQSCPVADDADARELWERARRWYRTPSSTGRTTRLIDATGVVTARDVGAVDIARRAGSRAYTTQGIAGATAGLASRGYVRELDGPHSREDFGAWAYPPLFAELAGHFVDSLFGAQHHFAFGIGEGATREIIFCARDRGRSGLDGAMRIDASDALLDARWQFWNPARRAEEAGGEVAFVAPSASRDVPLLSASGVFWRRLPSGNYYHRTQWYSAWRLMQE